MAKPQWTVIHIPPSPQGTSFYYNIYRPFRLRMLKESPESFSSTLQHEAIFPKERWIRRLHTPNVATFVAILRDSSTQIPLESQKIISALTVRGHFEKQERSPLLGTDGKEEKANPWFEINAVYTDPEYRRKGVASSVLEEAVGYVKMEMEDMGVEGRVRLVVGVLRGNEEAKVYYGKEGFVVEREDDEGWDMVKVLVGRGEEEGEGGEG